LDPYWQFQGRKPDAVLAGEILVFNGTFDVPRIGAMSHFALANKAMRAGHPERALLEAQRAEALAPELMPPHEMLASLYAGAHQPVDAKREYQDALVIYQTRYGEFKSATQPPEDPLPAERPVLASEKPPGK
jgi:hypothetical protein